MGERFNIIDLLEDKYLEPFSFGAGQPLTWQDEILEEAECEFEDKIEELRLKASNNTVN